MISTPIEATIRAAGPAFLTDLFLLILLAVFVTALMYKRNGKSPALTRYTPTLLTSLGVLGTFMGVVAGLLSFNTASIGTSITPLLEGLKTAFITSLFGMLLSIIYRVISPTRWFTYTEEGIDAEGITADDLYQIMNDQLASTRQFVDTFCGDDHFDFGQLGLLLKSQSDDISQINQRYREFDEHLRVKLEDFAQMISASATETIIDALGRVVSNFNHHLTEQFGENFRHFNEAIGELTDWQNSYREQLAAMIHQYDYGVQAISQAEVSITNISQRAESIPAMMDSLADVMTTNQQQINELAKNLEAFETVRDRAAEAIPEIRNQIDLTLAGAREASEEMAKGIINSANLLQSVVVESADQYRHTVDRTRNDLQESATAAANATLEIKMHFATTLEDINSSVRTLLADLREGGKQIGELYKEAGRNLLSRAYENSDTLKDSGLQLMSDLREISNNLSHSLDVANNEVIAGIRHIVAEFMGATTNLQQSLANSMEEQASEHRQRADSTFAKLEQSIENAVKNAGVFQQMQNGTAPAAGEHSEFFADGAEQQIAAADESVQQHEPPQAVDEFAHEDEHHQEFEQHHEHESDEGLVDEFAHEQEHHQEFEQHHGHESDEGLVDEFAHEQEHHQALEQHHGHESDEGLVDEFAHEQEHHQEFEQHHGHESDEGLVDEFAHEQEHHQTLEQHHEHESDEGLVDEFAHEQEHHQEFEQHHGHESDEGLVDELVHEQEHHQTLEQYHDHESDEGLVDELAHEHEHHQELEQHHEHEPAVLTDEFSHEHEHEQEFEQHHKQEHEFGVVNDEFADEHEQDFEQQHEYDQDDMTGELHGHEQVAKEGETDDARDSREHGVDQ